MTEANPQKLDKHLLKTLSIMQAIARQPELIRPEENGEVTICRLPRPHGDHFHLNGAQVFCHDATGLVEQDVWHALETHGLARSDWPKSITLTRAGLDYYTGVAREIFLTSDHGEH